eukprot:TRINITY_DN11332_c0_g1_i1.p1 TRINITY_DN11332_c0_g1~~TRINITY_DN11332_c0_g1_i1.p1  ORF type:complete len:271 (+),score=44.20 TRINITY_DN11332_c0_g1_i1:86-898(+)
MRPLLVFLLMCFAPHNVRGKVVVAMRHGERWDHVRPEWAAMASRPHDSPLSVQGFEDAENLGKHLKETLKGLEVVVYSSPLVRCIQTADATLHGMGFDRAHPHTPSINVDSCLAESETAMQARLMRTHKDSVPREEHVPEGSPYPVLLSPGDLISVSQLVNLTYTPTTTLTYDSEGWETHAGTRTSTSERLSRCLTPLLSNPFNNNKAVLLFAHGKTVRLTVQRLSGVMPSSVAYTQSFTMKPDTSECTEDMVLTESWTPPNVGGRMSQT